MEESEGEATPREQEFSETDEESEAVDSEAESAENNEDEAVKDVVPAELESAAQEKGSSVHVQLQLVAALRTAWHGRRGKGGDRYWKGRLMHALERLAREWRGRLSSSDWSRMSQDYRAMDDDEMCTWALSEGTRFRPACGRLWLELGAVRFSGGDAAGAWSCVESALGTAGLAVPTGIPYWEAARAFVIDTATDDDERRERELALWVRQLRTPLAGNEREMARFVQDVVPQLGEVSDIERWHAGARRAVEERREFESSVAGAASTGDDVKLVELWLRYVNFESKKDPGRARVVFERALAMLEDRDADRPVAPEDARCTLWEAYVTFAAQRLKAQAKEIAFRAVAAMPSNSMLQVSLVRAIERDPSSTEQELPAIADLTSQGAVLALCDAHRRRFSRDNAAKIDEVHDLALDGACRAGWPTFEIRRSKLLHKSPSERLKGWRHIVEMTEAKDQLDAWLDAARSAIFDQNVDEARRLHRLAAARFERAADKVARFRSACDAWLRFERDFGSIDDVDAAEHKIYGWQRGQSPQNGPPSAKITETNKVEPQVKVTSTKRKDAAQRRDRESAPPQTKRKKLNAAQNMNAERIARTIYVSHVSREAGEGATSEIFAKLCGPVRECRLHTDKKTQKPKGAAFVEFEDRQSVDVALKLKPDDLEPLASPDQETPKISRSNFIIPPKALPPAPAPPESKASPRAPKQNPFLPRIFATRHAKRRVALDETAGAPQHDEHRATTGEEFPPRLGNDDFRALLYVAPSPAPNSEAHIVD